MDPNIKYKPNLGFVVFRCRQMRSRDRGLDGLEGWGNLAVAGNVGSAELLDRGDAVAATSHGTSKVVAYFHPQRPTSSM